MKRSPLFLLRFLVSALLALPVHGALAQAPTPTPVECLIEPEVQLELRFTSAGMIDKVFVKRGDAVRQDQVIAQLESSHVQAGVELARFKSQQVGPIQLAKAKVDAATLKFERRDAMAKDKFIAQQERDDALAELNQAKAELVNATENQQPAQTPDLKTHVLTVFGARVTTFTCPAINATIRADGTVTFGGQNPSLDSMQIAVRRIAAQWLGESFNSKSYVRLTSSSSTSPSIVIAVSESGEAFGAFENTNGLGSSGKLGASCTVTQS